MRPQTTVTRRSIITGTLAAAGLGATATSATARTRSLKRGPVAGRSNTVAPARTVDSMLDEASSKFEVPGELLAAVGWNETRLQGNGGAPSRYNGYGIMQLVDNPVNSGLREAAKLTGLDPAALRREDAVNILGGAALLRAKADGLRLSAGDRGSVAAWLPAVAAYSGAADPFVADEYAAAVNTVLSLGVQGRGVHTTPKKMLPYEQLGIARPNAVTLPGTGSYTAPVGSPEPVGSAMPTVATSLASPANYQSASRPGDHPIQYIVIHVTQGSYAGSIDWFQRAAAGVSAHYVIRSSDGRITQCVDDSNIAWHAGNRSYNQRSIGIEHEGYVGVASWFTDAMYRSSAALVRGLCDRYGIPKTRARIIGHIEVPGATHTDPGPAWNWTKYMSYVSAGATKPSWQLVLDNTAPEFSASANWGFSDWNSQKWGADYRYAEPAPVTDTAWFAAKIPSAGQYLVECRYPAAAATNSLTPYVIAATGGNDVVYVNQSHLGGQWRSLGTYSLPAGYRNVVGVSRWAKSTGLVVADAVRLSKIG